MGLLQVFLRRKDSKYNYNTKDYYKEEPDEYEIKLNNEYNMFIDAALAGDVSAQVKIGKYCKAHGMKHSDESEVKQAAIWFRKAAKHGCSQAFFEIGYSYMEEDYLGCDYEKGIAYYNKAAEMNNTDALYWLGYCYDEGKGVIKNPFKAFEYFLKAADTGSQAAAGYVGLHFMKVI